MKGLVKTILFLIVLFVGILIVLKSVEYVHPNFSHGFLAGKKNVFDGIFKWGLYGHIILTPLLLLIASVLVFFPIEKRFKKLHRKLGIIYISAVLFLNGPFSLILAFNANTLGAVFAFSLLTLVWWYFTYRGLVYARRGDYLLHQQMMIRSYLLLISAVLLRIYGYIAIVHLQMYDYVTIVWLSWLPQLVIYETYVKFYKKVN